MRNSTARPLSNTVFEPLITSNNNDAHKPIRIPSSSTATKSGRNADLIMVLLYVFISESSRGAVIPGIVPFLTNILSSSSDARVYISYGIALFSMGRFVAALPYGYMMDYMRSTRNTLTMAIVITLFGTSLYTAASWVNDQTLAISMILLSRFIIGFGTGTLSVSRAFMVTISGPETRTRYILYHSIVQYIGFSVSPIVPVIISRTYPTTPDESWRTHYVYIPALFLIVGNLIMLMFIRYAMNPQDKEAPESPTESRRYSAIQHIFTPSQWTKAEASFTLFVILNLTLRGVVGVSETTTAADYQRRYSHSPDVIDESAAFLLYLGVAGLFTFVSIRPLERYLSPFTLLLSGMAAIVIGSLLQLPLSDYDNSNGAFVAMTVGAGLIWSIGSPMTQVMTISTYSQLMGRRPQGAVMGWLSTAGSIGRIIFPMIVARNRLTAHLLTVMSTTISSLLVIAFIRIYGRSTKS